MSEFIKLSVVSFIDIVVIIGFFMFCVWLGNPGKWRNK
jgi:hypothetical protein